MVQVLQRILFSFVLFGLLVNQVHSEPWSEKLGFPPGRPVVILDARELGLCWETNVAGLDLLSTGHASSAGVIATGPRFKDVAKWSKQHLSFDLGISIALTNPYDALTWQLMTSDGGPSSLVNADGYPWKTLVQFAVSAHAQDVQAELEAQIARAYKAGLQPTHISGYHGTLFSRPDLIQST